MIYFIQNRTIWFGSWRLKMKRLGISILLLCIMLYGCSKEHTEMDVISSHNATADNWYELDITVVVD